LEAGVAKDLNRRHGAHFDVPEHRGQRGHGTHSLVVEAANSILPEAEFEDLPPLARTELDAGLSGSLREAIAGCAADDPRLIELRDQLVARLGGTADGIGAITVTDQVYLGRLVHDAVPPAVTAGCITWYGHWRTALSGPSLPMAQAMADLLTRWQDHADRRGQTEQQIRQIAHRETRGDPRDLIASAV